MQLHSNHKAKIYGTYAKEKRVKNLNTTVKSSNHKGKEQEKKKKERSREEVQNNQKTIKMAVSTVCFMERCEKYIVLQLSLKMEMNLFPQSKGTE